jgi:hypothetical protein
MEYAESQNMFWDSGFHNTLPLVQITGIKISGIIFGGF